MRMTMIGRCSLKPVPTANGGVEGGRSQGVTVADDNWGMTNIDKAEGSTGADGEPMELSDNAGTGDPGDAATMMLI